jgi:hypothetical protein
VLASGENDCNQLDVSEWRDIVAITSNELRSFGLKKDGTVVATTSPNFGGTSLEVCHFDTSVWKNIVAISASPLHIVALEADGTVDAKGNTSACYVWGWRDIVDVSTSVGHTVGLKRDGTVVATGDNFSGECDVAGWSDIVAVSAGLHYTMGLKADGTVLIAGEPESGTHAAFGWRDILIPGAAATGKPASAPEASTSGPSGPAAGNLFAQELARLQGDEDCLVYMRGYSLTNSPGTNHTQYEIFCFTAAGDSYKTEIMSVDMSKEIIETLFDTSSGLGSGDPTEFDGFSEARYEINGKELRIIYHHENQEDSYSDGEILEDGSYQYVSNLDNEKMHYYYCGAYINGEFDGNDNFAKIHRL